MPRIVDILKFMSMTNLTLSWVEHDDDDDELEFNDASTLLGH